MKKEECAGGVVSNCDTDDLAYDDVTTPALEVLDSADESPITTHTEFFQKNFVFGSRTDSSTCCKSQDSVLVPQRRRKRRRNQPTLSTDSPTAIEVPALLSPTLSPDQELANAGEGNRPTVQPTILLPDSFEDTEWLIQPANNRLEQSQICLQSVETRTSLS